MDVIIREQGLRWSVQVVKPGMVVYSCVYESRREERGRLFARYLGYKF
jgi:hypothetical protein